MVLLGIDCGSTVVKASLVDEHGQMLVTAERRIPWDQPQIGWAERDMYALWGGVVSVIRDLLARTGFDPGAIQAIGCTGHGNGLYLLDQERHPLGNGILSVDGRARDLLNARLREGLQSNIFPYTLQKLYPAQTAVLLMWLKQHQPDVYARIGAVLLCKDYINFQLTGVVASDYSDMSAISLLDVQNQRYSGELLDQLRLAELEDMLPPLHASADVIGSITEGAAHATGLLMGTPVIAGMIDIAASAIGAGVTQPGQTCIIAGTWGIHEVIVDQPLNHSDLFLTSVFADPSYWMLVEASATSTTNLEWVIEQFCAEEKIRAKTQGVSIYELCDAAVVSAPLETQEVIFHPFIFDSNAHPTASAGFYGLKGWHTHAHLLRAVYEGIAFSHLYHIERLIQIGGAQITKARLTGGAARSAIWVQIFADTLQMSLEVPACDETGALGAALAAGVGIGHFKSLDEAVGATPIRRTYQSDAANVPHYARRYQLYRRLLEVLQPAWDEMAQLSQFQ